MSTYKGKFTVTNNTGSDIKNCVVSHVCSGQTTTTLMPCDLREGATSEAIAVYTQSSSKDHWNISFMIGVNLFIGDETCGFESDDDGGTVLIALSQDKFDIVMPQSSPCNNNSYVG